MSEVKILVFIQFEGWYYNQQHFELPPKQYTVGMRISPTEFESIMALKHLIIFGDEK